MGEGNGRVAKQTTVILVDDLDGTEAAEQVEFAVDGRSYQIDLSAANSAKLREALAVQVDAEPPRRPHRPALRRIARRTRPFANGRWRRA
jgi:hypothetical protein